MTEPREIDVMGYDQQPDMPPELAPAGHANPMREQDEASYGRTEPDVDPPEPFVPPDEMEPPAETPEQDEGSYGRDEPGDTESPDSTEPVSQQTTNVLNSAVGTLQGTEVRTINSAVQRLKAEQLSAINSAVLVAQTAKATLTRSATAAVFGTERVEVSQSVGAFFAAQGNLSVSQGGGSILAAANKMTVTMGGGSVLIAGRDIKVEKGGGATLIAGNEIEVESGFVGVVLSPKVKLKKDTRVLLNTPQAAAFGAFFGVLFALVSWRLRRA